MRQITQIVVHCSATKPNQRFTAKNIKRWHTDPEPDGNGWDDIGYHYVIRRDGVLERGRDIATPGAHARGHNKLSIGICLIGGIDNNGKPEQNYTSAQYVTLAKLLLVLEVTFPNAEIMGHNDLSNRDCPCFDVGEWWYGD